MVTKSTHDYEQHKLDIHNQFRKRYGIDRADKFNSFYSGRYDIYNRSFINYKLAYALIDDYKYCERIGTKWYAFVGVGGTGKSTLAKNVLYYLDPTFTQARTKTDMTKFIIELDKLPTTNALKSVFLDEPDDSITSTSKHGRILRKIFGKIRQQKIFIGICATDLKDIPLYIYRKLDGIFFCPYLGKAFYFRNRPKKMSYILQEIRQKYDQKGYKVFFELKNNKGCLIFDTIKATPLDYQDKEYLKAKAKDFKDDLKEFLKSEDKPKKQNDDKRLKAISNMKDKGFTQQEIAEVFGITRERVSQLLNTKDLG